MTERDLHKLDEWLAANVFGMRGHRRGDSIPLPTDAPVLVEFEESADEGIVICDETAFSMPHYSTDPLAFKKSPARDWAARVELGKQIFVESA